MKCQKCGKREANTHVKKVVNGEYEEYMICSECASQMGYGNVFSGFTTDFSNLLGSFFTNALPARTQAVRCEVCGSTYHDISKTGMVGCANCYNVFFDELLPTVSRIHGNTTHCGKRAVNNTGVKAYCDEENESFEAELQRLKKELQKAIENQEFEKAAELRDKIKEMEG